VNSAPRRIGGPFPTGISRRPIYHILELRVNGHHLSSLRRCPFLAILVAIGIAVIVVMIVHSCMTDGGWTRSGEADLQDEVPESQVEYSAAGQVHDECQQDDGRDYDDHPDQEHKDAGDGISGYRSRSSYGHQLPGVARLIRGYLPGMTASCDVPSPLLWLRATLTGDARVSPAWAGRLLLGKPGHDSLHSRCRASAALILLIMVGPRALPDCCPLPAPPHGVSSSVYSPGALSGVCTARCVLSALFALLLAGETAKSVGGWASAIVLWASPPTGTTQADMRSP
jgi:hypothetical protein